MIGLEDKQSKWYTSGKTFRNHANMQASYLQTVLQFQMGQLDFFIVLKYRYLSLKHMSRFVNQQQHDHT